MNLCQSPVGPKVLPTNGRCNGSSMQRPWSFTARQVSKEGRNTVTCTAAETAHASFGQSAAEASNLRDQGTVNTGLDHDMQSPFCEKLPAVVFLALSLSAVHDAIPTFAPTPSGLMVLRLICLFIAHLNCVTYTHCCRVLQHTSRASAVFAWWKRDCFREPYACKSSFSHSLVRWSVCS